MHMTQNQWQWVN